MGTGSLSRSITRRLSNANFINRYFKGTGIDIGGKPDPLAIYKELFSRIDNVYTWDTEDGDAVMMNNVADNMFDFVHSSHCLEHLDDPQMAIKNWIRILKPNGFLVITVPDEDLYEQGHFPSRYSEGHQWTFTILKDSSWSPKSINILDLLRNFSHDINIEKIELLNDTYRYELPVYDQTATPIGESGIEFIIQKKSEECKKNKGILQKPTKTTQQMASHLNGYIEDILTINKIKQEEYNKRKKEREEQQAVKDK